MKSVLILALVTLCHVFGTLAQGQGQGTPVTAAQTTLAIDKVFKGYDKRLRPSIENGTLNVSVNILVMDVFNVDETKHEFSVTMYLRQHWQDPRLQYNRLPGMNAIVLDADHASQLWTPDTFILNERSSVKHNFGTVQEYTRIRPDGRVLQSTRVSVVASCKMTLGYFPFDRQVCVLEFASYSQVGSDFALRWSTLGGSNGAAVSEDLSASSLNFRFTGIETVTKTLVYHSGNQTRLGLEFFFARHSIRFVQDVFFPVFLLTIIALCTLYCSSVILRIQLSVALMICMVLFMSFTSSWMPRVSYQTALDLYVSFSAFIIFLTLIANFVQYNFLIPSSSEKRKGLPLRDINAIEKSEPLVDYDRSNDLNEPLCEIEEPTGLRFGSKLDDILKKSCTQVRRYLPISYLCFNIIFWMVVLIGSSWYPKGVFAEETQE